MSYLFTGSRKPCSGYKLKEMSGSKIFAGDGENDSSESGNSDGNFSNRTSVRIVQVFFIPCLHRDIISLAKFT